MHHALGAGCVGIGANVRRRVSQIPFLPGPNRKRELGTGKVRYRVLCLNTPDTPAISHRK